MNGTVVNELYDVSNQKKVKENSQDLKLDLNNERSIISPMSLTPYNRFQDILNFKQKKVTKEMIKISENQKLKEIHSRLKEPHNLNNTFNFA